MAHITMPDLPPEVLHNIVKLLKGDLSNLRLVCTHLNLISEPEFFSCLIFDESTLMLEKSQLEMIASGRTHVSLHARSLKIKSLMVRDPQSENRFEANMKEHLEPAILSLQKLQHVMWNIDAEPIWIINSTINALARLPFLGDFDLAVQNFAVTPVEPLYLDRLPGLKRLSLYGMREGYDSRNTAAVAEIILKNPNIAELEVDTDAMYLAPEQAPSFHELVARVPPSAPLHLTRLVLREIYCRIDATTLPHLRSLTFLELSDLLDPNIPWLGPPERDELRNRVERYSSSISDAFSVLNREKIHLHGIVMNEVNSTILSYLESYSGSLQHLDMPMIDANSAEETDALAERFFNSVLPRHVGSIEVLSICPRFEGRWCYGNHAAALLLQCKRLSSLTIVLPSINLDQSSPSRPVHELETHFDDMVVSVMNLSLTLPYLTRLHLRSAYLEDRRGVYPGQLAREQKGNTEKAITHSLQHFMLRYVKIEGARALPDVYVEDRQHTFVIGQSG